MLMEKCAVKGDQGLPLLVIQLLCFGLLFLKSLDIIDLDALALNHYQARVYTFDFGNKLFLRYRLCYWLRGELGFSGVPQGRRLHRAGTGGDAHRSHSQNSGLTITIGPNVTAIGMNSRLSCSEEAALLAHTRYRATMEATDFPQRLKPRHVRHILGGWLGVFRRRTLEGRPSITTPRPARPEARSVIPCRAKWSGCVLSTG